MADNQTVFEFEAKDDVTPVVTGLIAALSKLNTALPQSDKALSKFETALATAATKAGVLGSALSGTVAPMTNAQRALASYQKTVNDFEARGARTNASGRLVDSSGRFISNADVAAYQNAARAIVSIEDQIQAKRAASASAHNQQQLAAIRGSQQTVQAVNAVGAATASATTKASAFASVWQNVPPNSTRYALYDVSNSLLILGAALSSGAIIATGFAASYQRAFADVQRTVNDLNPAGLDNLNQELLDLAATMPVTFQELSHIASLGGQLGIAGSGIDEFTESVAKISTVSDLTVDKAATAFGRFKAILGVPEEEFDNLASSILAVGVNSVATESQIVNISTQISSMAGFAGYTADQVIGLAGALASIGAPPELSRGVVTRVFATMSEAVAEGGIALDEFARISGVSSDQFAASWGTPEFAKTFEGFMRGIALEGGDAVSTLHDLGITSVRDVPLLMRLAGATDSNGKAFGLLAQTMKDAKEGWKDNTELARQYDLIASTFTERLKILGNNFANLAAAIGGPLLTVLTPLLNGLTQLLQFFTAIAANPIAGPLLAGAAGLAAIVGGLLLFSSLASRAVGGLIAMQSASNGLFGSFTATRAALAGMNAQMAVTQGAAARAGVAVTGLGRAAAFALGPIGLLIAALSFAPELAGAFDDAIRAVGGISQEFKQMKKDFLNTDLNFGQSFIGRGPEVLSIIRGLGDAASRGAGNVARMDEALAKMVAEGKAADAAKQYQQLLEQFKAEGGDVKEFNALFVDTSAALRDFVPGARSTAEAIGMIADEADPAVKELEELQAGLSSAAQSFIDNGSLITENQQRQVDAAKAIVEENALALEARGQDEEAAALRAGDAWKAYYDGQKLNLQSYLADLQAQVDALNNWQSNMVTLAQRGVSQGLLAELAKLGPEGAPLVEALATSTEPELQTWVDLMNQGGKDGGDAFGAGILETTQAVTNASKTLGGDVREQFLAEVEAGRIPFTDILKKYGLDAQGNPIPLKANDADLYNKAATFQQWVSRQTYYLNVTARITGMEGSVDANGRLNGPGYASGGYTGYGGKYQYAGAVHKGEFVFPQETVKRIGLPNLYAMMNSSKGATANHGSGFASGGYASSGMDAGSMQSLVQAIVYGMSRAQIALYSSDKKIAESASNGDRQLALQGSN